MDGGHHKPPRHRVRASALEAIRAVILLWLDVPREERRERATRLGAGGRLDLTPEAVLDRDAETFANRH